MLAVFLVFYGLPPSIHWLALVPIIIAQLLLMVVVSCLVAVIVPFVRDVSNLVPTGIQFLMFVSGIFFAVDHLGEKVQQIFYLNPVANILLQYRTVLLDQQWPDWSMLGGLLVAVAVGLLFVIWLYHKLEKLLPRVVIE
jgi:lipopolysaccharide transport system permease protein